MRKGKRKLSKEDRHADRKKNSHCGSRLMTHSSLQVQGLYDIQLPEKVVQ